MNLGSFFFKKNIGVGVALFMTLCCCTGYCFICPFLPLIAGTQWRNDVTLDTAALTEKSVGLHVCSLCTVRLYCRSMVHHRFTGLQTRVEPPTPSRRQNRRNNNLAISTATSQQQPCFVRVEKCQQILIYYTWIVHQVSQISSSTAAAPAPAAYVHKSSVAWIREREVTGSSH